MTDPIDEPPPAQGVRMQWSEVPPRLRWFHDDADTGWVVLVFDAAHGHRLEVPVRLAAAPVRSPRKDCVAG